MIFVNCLTCVVAAEIKHKKAENRLDEQIVAAALTQINCYESPKYLIISKEVQGRTGSDILVKYRHRPEEKFACNYIIGKNDFEVRNEWAEYFAGLKDDFLILDSTTGPGPSGLTIWDLTKRKKVYEGSWSDPEEIKNDSLTYWMETGEASDNDCPELKDWTSKGLGAAIETKVILNLSSLKISRTQEMRCSPRQ